MVYCINKEIPQQGFLLQIEDCPKKRTVIDILNRVHGARIRGYTEFMVFETTQLITFTRRRN